MFVHCHSVPLFVLLALCLSLTQALKEPPTTLQIGVKKRIPEEQCTMRSHDGDMLSMHYVGTLFDTGKQFDSSRDRNQPLEFRLGAGQVIQGWERGLKNMCIGEQRRLVIPPDLAYGDRGAGSAIPGGATLVFDVELVGIKPGQRPKQPITSVSPMDGFEQLRSPIFLASTAIVIVLLFIAYTFTGRQGKAKTEPAKASKASTTKSKKVKE